MGETLALARGGVMVGRWVCAGIEGSGQRITHTNGLTCKDFQDERHPERSADEVRA